ncbi:V-type ATPase assembly factor Pkr1p [Trichomonascus vanleenenianus]|uniref:Pkr1p n=1 Tax=Trichomonascus vanleenenianus TaxID=2268995 RepID=UPI003ECB9F7D
MEFVTDLWKSILEPGANPALIKATHFSFGALLLTLVSLLVATWNYHFAMLSLIAAGLWAAITWFITEIEAEKERLRQQEKETAEEPQKIVPKTNPESESTRATESTKATGSKPSGTRSRKI